VYRYGKLAQGAVAALSRLAEVYHDDGAWVSAAELARARNLPRPVLAKILGTLAQHGLVAGFRGPTGGYRLARPPGAIRLLDVVMLFERPEDEGGACPFGPGWCGRGAPCPVHHRMMELRQAMLDFLTETHLDVFQAAPHRSPRSPRRSRPRR
jgi:Rrf2 family iron-sulfur cluster assembly transcriptional regulator